MLNVEPHESMQMMLCDRECHILLVSSVPLFRFTMQNFFKDSGMMLFAAGSIQEGLDILGSEKVDAVLSEIRLDTDDGFILRRKIRKTDPLIPILYMTSLINGADNRLLGRIIEDSYSYYIPKNADKKFLLGKLRQVIRTRHAENSLMFLQKKIERNWFLASLLQQAMLPPWVYFSDSYEFSCFYRPFTRVSGDLFEWLPLDEDRALFIFGDVSGHGTHSALAMTAVQSFLKQLIAVDREKARYPSVIAAEINDFFCRQLHNIVYMGALVAYMDFRHNYLRYHNAGYMDLICFDAETGRRVDVNPERKGSLPLGLMGQTVYSCDNDVEFHFQDSSVFLFFSDGLMDLAREPEGKTGMDMELFIQLMSILVKEGQKEEKSIAIPFRCYHTLEQFGYLFPQDDLSMMLIRKPLRLDREDVFTCRIPADKKAVDQMGEKASAFVMNHYRQEKFSVDAELLLEEYLVNVVQHGLDEYEKLNEYLVVKLRALERELKITVWDRGREWDGAGLLPNASPDEMLDGLNEQMASSGRGLPIIAKIASQMSRQRYGGVNESIFIVPVGRPD